MFWRQVDADLLCLPLPLGRGGVHHAKVIAATQPQQAPHASYRQAPTGARTLTWTVGIQETLRYYRKVCATGSGGPKYYEIFFELWVSG